MARRRGRAVPGYPASDGQGQFGRGLLLHGFLLAACCIRHEPDGGGGGGGLVVISSSRDKSLGLLL